MKNYKIWIFTAFLLPLISISPFFYPPDWPKAIALKIIVSIILLGVLKSWFLKKRELNIWALSKNPVFLALCFQLGAFLLSTIFSVDSFFSFWGSPHRGGGFLNFLFFNIFAVLISLAFQKENQKEWQKLFKFNFIIASIICLIAFLQLLSADSTIRPGSTLANPIYLAIYLLLLFFPLISFLIKENDKANKYFYGSICLLFLATLFITGSRAAWLGLLLGGFYFLINYPNKISDLNFKLEKNLKRIALSIFIISTLIVAYANIFPSQALNRLSFDRLAQEGRFGAWEIITPAILEKPLLGWGYENFSIPFDAHYNPAKVSGDWWDKAHNIFLDLLIETGILGFLAYIALFVVLFWQLKKIKQNANTNKESRLMAHAIQASFLGYLTANFFSFDSFATYLIFFIFAAWTMSQAQQISANLKNPLSSKPKLAFGTIAFFFLLFIWQYNALPFYENTRINISNKILENDKCNEKSLKELNNMALNSKILTAYAGLNYAEATQKCFNENQLENKNIIIEAMPALEKAAEKQPYYTRFWIILAKFTTILGAKAEEENNGSRQEFLNKAYNYLEIAEKLSPMRQEIILERVKIKFIEQDYIGMIQESEKCINLKALTPPLACYFARGIAYIYLKNIDQAKEDIKLSEHWANSTENQYQLINAWIYAEKYEEIIPIYEHLVRKDPSNINYLASLAEAYRQTSQYDKARQTALSILDLFPESKTQVDNFLKILP